MNLSNLSIGGGDNGSPVFTPDRARCVESRNEALRGFDEGFREALYGSRVLLVSLFVCYVLQLLAGAARSKDWGFPLVPWLSGKLGYSVSSGRCWEFVDSASWSASWFFVVLLNFRAFVGLAF